MKLKLLSQLHRSMFGQMLVLSLVFVIGVVYYIAISPIIGVEVVSQDPVDYTVEKVRQELRSFIDIQLNADKPASEYQYSPAMAEIVSNNPNFQYYLIAGTQHYGNVDAPAYYQKYQLDDLLALNQKINLDRLCTNFYEVINEDAGDGYVQFNACSGQYYYLEFYGLTTPVVPPQTSYLDYYQRHLWGGGRDLLLSAIGVMFITGFILLYNLRSIKKLANLAYSFNPKKLHQKLPENGLPNEVLPLVQAVNNMIARVDETQQKHNFFLSTAAHEMRTPLTVLRTRLEMLDEGKVKDKLVDDVRRLINLVNQLLRLMRIGGPKSLDSQVDVAECCRRVVAERQIVAAQSGVELAFTQQTETYVITGDQGLLEVAVANLVDNAVSFSQAGDKVELTLHREGKLTVSDSGPGIPDDKLDALFEPFAKFPPNRNGHGLGLAIVKAITALHEAEVSVQNRPEGGAIFTISFKSPSL
ncbi:sensor histidine kinase [Alteromonas lipolytica]|uniref:histidine kinase n=1 Tax=Alteromonas lipolytica TaxID=1856405 RepID=A0A1E8FE23_9ALTE|nr:HAMP domain-containing sensor histidine kinase [Alteromonas lipolytica]OFI34170.1 hypothetical protein BFC17_21775 [Alteromonas lipolytica]